MITIMHTTRQRESGDLCYAVLCNGQPICSDTGDKDGTLALARRKFNESRPPARLQEWISGQGAPATIEEK